MSGNLGGRNWRTHLLLRGEDDAGHLIAAPELVIEVLSSGEKNQRRDRESKLKLYSTYGVLEYWIVDRQQLKLEVYRRDHVDLKASCCP